MSKFHLVFHRLSGRAKLAGRTVVLIQLLLISAVAGDAQSGQKLAVLNACAHQFGAPIDAGQNLFEVNPLFALRPRFDAQGELINLSVFPKYFLEKMHPEWTEPPHWPLFSDAEYRGLLRRLDSVAPAGKFIAAETGGFVTNSTDYPLEQYENAYVVRGRVVNDVRFFDVYPFHRVTGRIRKFRRYKSFFGLDLYQVLIGEFNYFVRRGSYRGVKRGRTQSLLVAGPIGGYCFASSCNQPL